MAPTTTLLSLPPEIRNRVYAFVLTSTSVLCYHDNAATPGSKAILYDAHRDDTGRLFQSANGPTEFNQLKYANRQLYSETAALEFRFNTLVFQCPAAGMRPSGAQFLAFLQQVPEKTHAWLSNIKLEDTLEWGEHVFVRDSPETLEFIDRFCSKHPNMSVRYTVPFWVYHRVNRHFKHLIIRGMFCSYALRGCDKLFLCRPDPLSFMERVLHHETSADPECIKTAREWGLNKKVALNAPNLRFVPLVLGYDGDCVKALQHALTDLPVAMAGDELFITEAARSQVEQWATEGL